MNEKIGFGSVIKAVRIILPLNLLVLLFMSLFRLLFFVYFRDGADYSGSIYYLLKAFFMGARFDLAVVAYINTLVTLTLLLSWSVRKKNIFLKWAIFLKYYYFFMFSLVVLILAVDFGFFSYFKEHINILVFGFWEDDTAALLKTIAQNPRFPAALLVICAAVSLLYYGSKKTSDLIKNVNPAPREYSVYVKIIFVVLLVSLNTLAARGSLRMFPLGTIYAEISPDEFLNKLCLNGVFTLREALASGLANKNSNYDAAEKFGYGGRVEKAFLDYLNIPEKDLNKKDPLENLVRETPENKTLEKIKPNVVVIVMESFGANLERFNTKDFDLLGELKKHFDSDYVFHNFLPAGLITIHALESITLNIPQRPGADAITQSRNAFIPFPCDAALPFKNSGYETVFVYGGSLNWRGFNSFYPSQRFDRVVGESAMPKNSLHNQWGVYDEYLFEQLYDELNSNTGKPKFILVMTTSNHPPYSAPPSYKPGPLNYPKNFKKTISNDSDMVRKRLITYQYANQKLGEFITRVKESKLGENTIIAVTGDHNFWDIFDYKSSDLFYKYTVPFYLYVPRGLAGRKPDTAVYGSHIDIMPTLYNLSLSKAKYMALGNDLFDGNAPHIAFNIEGFIISKGLAAKNQFKDGKTEYYTIDGGFDRKLIACAVNDYLEYMLKYYKASVTISDYLVKSLKENSKFESRNPKK